MAKEVRGLAFGWEAVEGLGSLFGLRLVTRGTIALLLRGPMAGAIEAAPRRHDPTA